MKEDILLCQITSKAISKDKHAVEITKEETLQGSLMIESYVRTNMLFTASKNQIQKRICTISRKKYKEIVKNYNWIN